jgi:hypothetical protein
MHPVKPGREGPRPPGPVSPVAILPRQAGLGKQAARGPAGHVRPADPDRPAPEPCPSALSVGLTAQPLRMALLGACWAARGQTM